MSTTPNRSSTPRTRIGAVPPASPGTPRRQNSTSTPVVAARRKRLSGMNKSPLGSSPVHSPLQQQSPRKLDSPLKSRDNIKVIARLRPETETEKAKGESCLSVIDTSTLSISGESFAFDRVFDSDASQSEVFEFSMSQTVDDLFNGYNGTVLAYGQTGSGKTYTMMGSGLHDEDKKGVIPRISELIFRRIGEDDGETECTLSASYMEIYMEQIRDLLTPNKHKQLTIHEDGLNGVHVRNLTKFYLGSIDDVLALLQRGSELRAVGSTDMNLESSRSHAILQIDLTQENLEDGIKRSKLFLVDLAGSEKVGKTGASGQTLEEAKKINSSLSALGNVISALTDSKSSHIPYRDSKLTRILQESLGGNSRTSLLINCSPSSFNESETLSTLRFGSRAKKIKNRAHVNAEPSQFDLVRQIEHLQRVNQEQELRIKEMDAELDLWKNGINKIEASLGATVVSDYDDTLINSPGSHRKVEYLESRVSELTALLSASPSYANAAKEDIPLVEQLKDSQTMNKELLADLENKCLLLVDLQLQLDAQVVKPKLTTAESDRVLALDRTLEQFAIKIDELEKRNHLFAQEVQGLRSIAQTRSERIKTLERLVEDSRSDVQQESKRFEYKFFSLRDRLLSVRKLSNPPSAVDLVGASDSHGGGLLEAREGGRDMPDHLKSFHTDLIIQDPDDVKGLRRTSTSSGSINSGNEGKKGSRMGLNLNVLKPITDDEN